MQTERGRGGWKLLAGDVLGLAVLSFAVLGGGGTRLFAAPIAAADAQVARVVNAAAVADSRRTGISHWNDDLDEPIARAAVGMARMQMNDTLAINRRTAFSPAVVGLPKQESFAPALLTIMSVALAMGALGVLIRNQPARAMALPSAGALPTIETGHDARQTMVRCVAVLVVLNLFDLMCTLLAARTGGLLEVNPLGRGLLETPLLLAGLKVAAIGMAAAILLKFWRYRIAQLTSWWSSALYTVLMIRWATYNSFFLY